MPLAIPNLDDRRWTDLVEDAQALIPRLAPRWTDHNVHDPGITFIELFAWLAEMQIYQLNRVGDRHREVFGRLAGVTRRHRTPAHVEVFVIGDPARSVTLPAETQLTPLEGEEIVFETPETVLLTRSRLERVVVDDGSGPLDQTDANQRSGVAFLAFGERARPGAQLQLGFDRFYPGEEPTIRISIDVFTADLDDRCGAALAVPAETDTPGEIQQPVEIAWEYLDASGQWRALAVVADETAAFSRSGAVTLAVPSDSQTLRQHVWIRARIRRGTYDIEPRLLRVAVNGIPCVQRETVRDERLGQSDGRPNQSFVLAGGPLLIDQASPVVIDVDGERWEPVASLENAAPSSRQFVFDTERRRVSFGNGLNGQTPRAGQTIRALSYQTSVGAAGNVTRGLAWRFKTAFVPGVTLVNFQPAFGGSDPESLADLELRARAVLNRPSRAITPSDIERLALGTPGVHVARATVLPNCPSPARITVVAMPKVRPGRNGPPSPPSSAFLLTVHRHLQTRRLLGDDVRVVAPIYIEISVAARLRLAKGAGPASVIQRARLALQRFFDGEDPAAAVEQRAGDGAPSPCPTRWPFGRAVFPSEVYAVLDGVPGVDAVSSLRLSAATAGAAVAAGAAAAIPVPPIGVAFSGMHDLAIDDPGSRA
jgi:hypothetical protein